MKYKTVLSLKHKKNNPRNSEGSFVTLKDGRILYIYTHYYDTDNWRDHALAKLMARYSSDDGNTWTDEDELVIDNREANQNIMSVSLLRLHDGRIAMFYSQKNSLYDCKPVVRFSSDEAQNWSAPVHIINDIQGYFVLNNDRVIQTENSRLIVPVALHPFINNGSFFSFVIVFYSDNTGTTWHQGGLNLPPQSSLFLQEPGLIELDKNLLKAFYRTNDNMQFTSFSYDNGLSWTPAERDFNFPSPPESPMSMKKNPCTGEIIAVWNDHEKKRCRNIPRPLESSWSRTPLCIAFSNDNAKTWERHLLIEDAPGYGFCYTAIHFVKDAILLAYCCGGGDESAVLQDLKIIRLEKKKDYCKPFPQQQNQQIVFNGADETVITNTIFWK